jgi:hypothetical protein
VSLPFDLISHNFFHPPPQAGVQGVDIKFWDIFLKLLLSFFVPTLLGKIMRETVRLRGAAGARASVRACLGFVCLALQGRRARSRALPVPVACKAASAKASAPA